MGEEIKLGLTFDDVLLIPKKSSVKSRKEIVLKTRLTKNIEMNMPLISANMDTVTEHKMAVVLARAGGIGIIHRYLTVEDQVSEVLKVKRSESMMVEDPYTLSKDHTIAEAKQFMKENGVGGLLIVDDKEKLAGILSKRDILFAVEDKKVSEVMTKNSSMVTVSEKISFEKARKILHENRIEKLPVVDKDNNILGLITSKDLRKAKQHPQALKDKKGRLMVGAAIGVKQGFLERARELVLAGVDVLVIDIAHGHSELALNALKEIKKNLDIDVIVGNVATVEGVKDLAIAGADAIKVGVGPGSICTTRIVSGSGYPQLSAIMECSKEAKKHDIPIIADGGIKTSGDLAKALAAGASSSMMGNLFAGTDEAPGLTILKNGRKYKVSRGMASFGAALGRKEKQKQEEEVSDIVPEGVEAMVPYKGSADEVIRQLLGGLRSGISYCGSKDIPEMQSNAEFVRITNSGMRESKPHDVDLV